MQKQVNFAPGSRLEGVPAHRERLDMMKSKRGPGLERWEVALIKAMLERGDHNDQEILAYFTRPIRSVSHRVIGEIRTERKRKAVAQAAPKDLDGFLANWPDVDPLTGLSARAPSISSSYR
jgi:hypothetical protein